MSHCVGGYAINCLRNGYHIFSIINDNGERASTFTCADALPENSRPQVKFSQNQAHHNTAPPQWAAKAATEFMRRINEGELNVDWSAIYESKAEFMAHEVDMAIGFNFREEQQRDRVYAVFGPLVPRKIAGEARTSTKALAGYLDVESVVAKFISAAGSQLGDLGIRAKAHNPERPELPINPQILGAHND